MKVAFKSVLIVNYTQNPDNLDFPSVKNYLESNSLLGEYDFDDLVSAFDGIIRRLIEEDLQDPEALEDFFKGYKSLNEQNCKEFVNVWEAEKEGVFTHMLRKNTSSKYLDKLEWSINKQTYSRRAKNINDLSTILNFRIKDPNSKQVEFLNFEMNPSELKGFYVNLKEIETAIGGLLE